jgi:hypothetical protein
MVNWYSIDRNLSVIDRGIATKEDAMHIIEDHFARVKPAYDSGEEALAETTFGFQRSKEEFIEISISSAEQISFRYEISLPRKILFLSFPKILQVEKTLSSKEEVNGVVSLFYDLDSRSFLSRLRA